MLHGAALKIFIHMMRLLMKEKEWQKFAAQSVVLLIVAMVFCIFHSVDFIKDSGTRVMADDNLSAEYDNEPEMAEVTPSVEEPTHSDEVHVKKRSNTYIMIPKSEVATGSAVYLSDDYMKSTVCLTISGMRSNRFSTDNIARVNGDIVCTGKADAKNRNDLVKGFTVKSNKLKNGQYKIEIDIRTRNLYEPLLFETDKAYYISLAVPHDIYDRIVVIDAGHGGIDEGTSSSDGKDCEKKYTLLVARELKNILDKSDIKVYYTRLNDKHVSKTDRTALANKLNADLFISIHCNASQEGDNISYGVEALYSKRKSGNAKLSNKKLADLMMNSVADEVDNRKRGVIRREGLYLLHHANVPTTIIEIGYMSNKSDLKYIKKKSGQKKIAQGIYSGIKDAFKIAGK